MPVNRFKDYSPNKPHLVRPGGLKGEVQDLRKDLDDWSIQVSNAIDAGTGGITELTGDVTTPVGTGSQVATVEGIQGNPVSAAAPASGDALVWDGAQWAPAAGGGGGTVTSVTASLPLVSSGGATPDISITAGASDGDLLTWDVATSAWVVTPGATDQGITELTGDVTAGPGNGSQAATVARIQGYEVATAAPANGNVLAWSTAQNKWVPGAPAVGGGAGGVTFYLNASTAAAAPTTNIPVPSNIPGTIVQELGTTVQTALATIESNDLTQVPGAYDLVANFVTPPNAPGVTSIPAGLWDFNIWASSTGTNANQTVMQVRVYKYDGAAAPTLIATSDDVSIYDPTVVAQYILTVVIPAGVTLLATDRVYIELRARAVQNNRRITFKFGDGTPTHVQTTLPSAAGGDLSGTYPNPTVAKIQGNAVSAAAPADGEVLAWSAGTSEWTPTGPGIGGTIAANEVAFGTGVDSIGGSANLTWDAGTSALAVTGDTSDCLTVASLFDGQFLAVSPTAYTLVITDPLTPTNSATMGPGDVAVGDGLASGNVQAGLVGVTENATGNRLTLTAPAGLGTLTSEDSATNTPVALNVVCEELQVNANPGNAGEVLTSQGAGSAPIWAPASGGGGFGSKVLLCVEGGVYATIQDAINAAADWDVILVGPKAAGASWGPAVFSPGKRLVVSSLLSKWSTQVRVDSITFNANSGLNILNNTVFVRGLFINSSFTALAPGVNFYGSAPARLRLQECFIYNSNAAAGTGVVSNNSGSGSSLYIDNCIVQSGWSTGIGVDHQQGYTAIRNDSEISRYQYPLQCAAGTVEIIDSVLDGTGIANEVIRITGGFVTCGYSTIKNSTANASGVNITVAAVGVGFGMGDATFAIATGSGYCVTGAAGAAFLYGHITYSNSAAAAYNVKVKNTLSAIPTTQAFTPSA